MYVLLSTCIGHLEKRGNPDRLEDYTYISAYNEHVSVIRLFQIVNEIIDREVPFTKDFLDKPIYINSDSVINRWWIREKSEVARIMGDALARQVTEGRKKC